MRVPRDDQALEIRLRPQGAGRFVSAAFLGVWLCGWLAGEVFVLWVLGKGAVALLTGTPPEPGAEPLELAPTIGVGLFLVLWLSFWTLGGVAAIQQFLRSLWAEDRLVVLERRLFVRRSTGPFRSSQAFDRESIHGLAVARHRETLTLWTHAGSVELSVLGTRDERREAATLLHAALALPEVDEASVLPVLPDGWEEIVTLDGERAVAVSRKRRRLQALLASLGTLVLCGLGFVISRESPADGQNLAIAVIVFAIAALAGYGALWLARGRREWVLGRGQLRLQSRFGSRCRILGEARELAITMSTDSDGDERFQLVARLHPDDSNGSGSSPGKRHRTILTTLRDPTGPRQLGAWLARATGLPLEDRGRPDRVPVDLAELEAQLEQAGAFGRWLARWIRARQSSSDR